MKLYEILKRSKRFVICVLIAAAFFFVFLVNNHIEMQNMKKKYETQLEEMKSLVNVTRIGESSETEFDIYETASEFLKYYYGVSENVPAGFREERLQNLMTEQALSQYDITEYDNTQNYSITFDDIRLFVDYKNSTENDVYACIFYDENIDWPNINTITLKKYWRGTFTRDIQEEKWKLDDIEDCQELLTREEFNALNVDTNGSVLETYSEGGEIEGNETVDK